MTTTTTEPAITPVRVGVAMMSQTEARYTVERIKTHFDSARRLLVDLEEREGWRALGYANWRECAAAEFGQSQTHLYRQLAAAKIELAIDSPIGEIPESHLRPLTALDTPAEQRAALDRADELAGDGARTAKHVQQAVEEQKPTRVCGRCKEPSRDLTGYGPGLFPGYPNGVVVCGRCVRAVLRERSTTNGAAAPTIARCEDCGAPATNKQTIGGMSAHRCDVCTFRAAEQEQADQAEAAAHRSDGPLAQLTALCERAEALGAQVNYVALSNPAMVRVIPPPGYQQHPLDCDADDLTPLVEAWERHAAPAPAAPTDEWGWPPKADAALSRLHAARNDQLRAVRAAAALTVALAGDATRLALIQAPKAASVLEAEGYASVAALLRLLAPESEAP